MDTQAPKDFFISYTHADQRWAEWIAWHLEAEGYHTMLQAWNFVAGSNFVLEMDASARQATHTIAVLSPDYFTSTFTPSEWAAAFKRDPKGDRGLLLPVRVRPCDVEGLLGQIVYIDLVDQEEATARTTLLHGIKHQRRKPSSPPDFPTTKQAPQSSEQLSFPGALPAVWNIPYPRNPYFTGREELLRRLAASLRAGETVGVSQPQAVHGLGGVGKTQIALEYAYRYYQDYDAVLWTRADTQEALISGFVVFAALLHLPVQAVLKDGMDVSTYHQWAERVVQVVNNALPDDVEYRTYARYKRCLPHAQECAQLIEQEHLTSFAAGRLFMQTGGYLWQHARYTEAEAFYQHSLRIREQVLGANHSDVVAPLYNLAVLLKDQGKYDKAEPLYQRALRIREQVLGPDHPEVAAPLNNLANLYKEHGKLAMAEPLYQRAWHNTEQALGSDHPNVAYPITGLAVLYFEQGKYAEAEPLYQRALHIREQKLGSDHPFTRIVVRNYAILLRKVGREAEASELEARFHSA